MRPTVLIVEDDAIVALDICEQIEDQNYKVIGITDSGRKAIELAKKHHPDVVVMDIHIKADLNGAETAVCIQGLYERPIPILFVTGYATKDFPLIAAVNPYTVVAKPFSRNDLIEACKSLSIQQDENLAS